MVTVLIVDDNDDVRELVRIRMEQDHAEVVGEAARGQDAIREWRATHPDVIILDHLMPDMTGLEVAKHILSEQPSQAIVIYSAFAEAEELASAPALGVRAVVGKSHLGSLVRVVRQCAAA